MRFSKTFFAFTFFPEYSYKKNCLPVLAEDETELFFTVNLMTSFSRQKPSTSKNPKTYDCLEYEVLLAYKNSAQTVNN